MDLVNSNVANVRDFESNGLMFRFFENCPESCERMENVRPKLFF